MGAQPHESYTDPQSIEFSKEERELAIIQLGARIDEMTPLLSEAGKKGDTKRVVELAQHIENVRKVRDKFYVKQRDRAPRYDGPNARF